MLLSGCSLTGQAIPRDMILVKETEHALFYVRRTDEDVDEMVKILSRAFEQHYHRITDMLRFEPPGKTVVFIHTDIREFQKTIGRKTEGTYDADDRRIKVHTPANLGTDVLRKAYADQLIHEFVHAVILQLNPAVGRLKWLDEGTAYYVSGQLQDELESGRRAHKSVPELDHFLDSDSYFATAGGDAYYFSGLVVKYIFEEFGEDRFRAILRDPDAMASILGLPVEEFYDAWKEYVRDLQQSKRVP